VIVGTLSRYSPKLGGQTEPIDRVEVTGPVEFAIAQIRYVVGMDPAHQTYILFVVLLQLLLLSIILLG